MFRDRKEAGIKLADRLKNYRDNTDVLVLALPRGGVVTAFEVSKALRVPLDVLLVRKIGVPWQPELAAGAVSETGAVVLNNPVISGCRISQEYLDKEISNQKEEIRRRDKLYRKGKGISALKDKIIILIDDGVATGATMKAAIGTLRNESIRKLVTALPVSPPDTAEELKQMSDEFICLGTPEDFMAVGNYYLDFTQVSDEEVVNLLKQLRHEM